MNLILDDVRSVATVYDFDRTEWYKYSAQTPDSYTMEFQPELSEDDLNFIANGREIYYAPHMEYDTVHFEAGHSTQSRMVYVQQLLPKSQET
jgi:hypothetical protein